MLTRRELIRNGVGLMGATTIHSSSFWDFLHKKHFRIGACDWSIGKTADITGWFTGKSWYPQKQHAFKGKRAATTIHQHVKADRGQDFKSWHR